MKTITISILAVALVGCGKSDETVSIGTKENVDKGMAVIDQRQKDLLESDRKLFKEEPKSQKQLPTSPQ